MRFAFVSITSGLARWSYWDGAANAWQPVAAEIAVTSDGFPVQWTRLHVRRDFSALSEGDLWINGKPVAVKVPVSPSLSGFQIRAASTIGSYVDALTFSDHQTLFPDSDDDGMPDTWELVNATTATSNDRLADPDADTVVNIREYLAGSDPNKEDSDLDGMPDAWEILYQLNPADGRDSAGDFDADGVSNLAEYESTPKTNPRVPGGNGPNVIYLKANNGSDPAKDGSWGHPYADFATALDSVPDGGRLVIVGSGGSISFQSSGYMGYSAVYSNSSTRTLTITGVEGANFTGRAPYSFLQFFNSGTANRSVTLDNLTFYSCQSDVGSLLTFNNCPAIITRCRFLSCISNGAVVSFNAGSASISDSSFTSNSCNYGTGGGTGGGAVYANGTSLSFERNRFIGNQCAINGGALLLAGSTGSIANCLFTANRSNGGSGSAVYLTGAAVPKIAYCTIADNLCSSGAAIGSAATVPVEITASILWGNKFTSGTTINNLSGPATVKYCTTQTTSYNTATNTTNNTINPLFLRDYHLQLKTVPGDGYSLSAGSPMIDRGAPASGSLAVPSWDLDGLPRRQFLSSVGSYSLADRGAFEYNDTDGDNMPDGWETRYGFDPNNPNERDLDQDEDGYTNYEEYSLKTDPLSWQSRPATVVYVSPSGLDTAAGSFTAPVKTISKAIALVPAGGRIAMRDGHYAGVGNTDLPATFKGFSLNGIKGAGRVTIDGGNSKRFMNSVAGVVRISGVTIRNCAAPAGGDGGALFQVTYGSEIQLYRCRFVNCRAPGRGGAVFFNNGGISSCEFLGNTANEGGAAAGSTNNEECVAEIQSNTFAWNDATQKGGAMAFSGSGMNFSGAFQAMISGNSFYRNTALTGGGVAFTNSISQDDGSGSTSNPTVNTPPRNCLDYSAASYYYLSNSMLMGNVFTENSAWPTAGSTSAAATARGAAVALLDSTLWVEGDTYENNYSAGNGGALHQTTGVSQIHRSKFFNNQASADGGAVSLTTGSPLFNNCAFVRNEAGGQGGVLRSAAGSTLTLVQSTLTWNKAATGASACQVDGSLIVHNSLIWYNLPTTNSLAGAASLQIFGTNSQPGSFILPSTTPPSGNTSVEPALAYDQYHLTGQPVATLGLGRVEVAQLPQNQITNPWLLDLEQEVRPCTTANRPEAGCDEFLDSDGDTLPDWYEKGIQSMLPNLLAVTPQTLLSGSTITAGDYWFKGANPFDLSADSDGDGVSDRRELTLSGLGQNFNPRSTDSDGNGTPDIDPEDLNDPDKDSDGDGLVNGQDAVPNNKLLMFPRLPERKYAVIDLGEGTAYAINASGQTLCISKVVEDNYSAEIRGSGPVQTVASTTGTYKLNEVNGISDQGAVYFSVKKELPRPIIIRDTGTQFSETSKLSVVRLCRWQNQTVQSLPTASDPPPTPWGEWTTTNLSAGDLVTAAGSLFGGTQEGYSEYRTHFPRIVTGDINRTGSYTMASVDWKADLTLRAGPRAIHRQTDTFYANPAVEGYDSELELSAWAAVSREGDGLHFKLTKLSSGDYESTETFWKDLDGTPTSEVCSFDGGVIAIASIPVVTGRSAGPLVITYSFIDATRICKAWVRTEQGWRGTALESSPGTSLVLPPEVTAPPHGRRALTANAKGEILLNNTLWRNGHAQSISELVPDLSPSFVAADMNAQGAICGTFQSDSGPHAAILLPVEVNNLDRFVKGSISESTLETFGGLANAGIQIVGKNSGKTYGKPQLSEAFVHGSSTAELNSEGEVSKFDQNQLDQKAWKSDMIYSRKDGQIAFMTTLDTAEPCTVKFLKNGQVMASMDYDVKANAEAAKLVDALYATFKEAPFFNNGTIPAQYRTNSFGPVYDDIPLDELGGPPALLAARASRSFDPFNPEEYRNLVTRCMEAAFDELKKTVTLVAGSAGGPAGEAIVKYTCGYATGFVQGIWNGLKSDWEGVVELKNLLLHPIDTCNGIREGFKAMLGLNKDQWKQLGQQLFKSMMSSAEQNLPWDYKGESAADQIGLVAYFSGYGTGFVAEQATMIYLGAGLVTKIGPVIKGIMEANKLGQMAGKVTQAIGLVAGTPAKVLKALARKSKSAVFNWWCRFARNEDDFARIARALEGLDNPLIPDANAFHHALRHIGDALEGLDATKINPRKLLDELGDEISFKRLDELDLYGRSHVGQYLHRVGQMAQLLKAYGQLSEEALLGFARAYRFLSVRMPSPQGLVVRDRAYDLFKLFDIENSNAAGKKLADTLKDYAVATQNGVGDWQRFVVPKVHELFPNLYRIADSTKDCFDNGVPSGNLLAFVKQNRRLPKSKINPTAADQLKPWEGHYVSPDVFPNPEATRKAFQIDRDWSNCDMRFTVRSQSMDGVHKCIIPNSASRKTDPLKYAHEPRCIDNPIDSISGESWSGKGRQLLTEGGDVTKIEVWNGSSWVVVPFN